LVVYCCRQGVVSGCLIPAVLLQDKKDKKEEEEEG
jgi:hypothetical protein